ncbi:MAG: ferredoxin family protein [Candidatus Kryptoniota bacterium]
MPKDLTQLKWHGIPRKEIPWFPTLDEEACIGCGLCYVSCGREVYEYDDKNRHVDVPRPYNCMVGCSTCATVCPTQAISFPQRDAVWKMEREFRIFGIVRQAARTKKEKEAVQRAREQAQELLNKITTRMHVELAGAFGEKKFLVKLRSLIESDPFDIVNLKMEVPTVKGSAEGAPSYMSFDLTSTGQEDVTGFMDKLRRLVKDNELVLVNEVRA